MVASGPGKHLHESRRIVGCAMEVLNVLGHGLLEKPYERALVVELDIRAIAYRQQPTYPVIYKTREVGYFVPDLVVMDRIVVDTKVVDRIGDSERGQMLNYLGITGLEVGLMLNFRRPKLEWRRICR